MSAKRGNVQSVAARSKVHRKTRSAVAQRKKKFVYTYSTSSDLPTLNTDCLLKIFEYLSMADLLTVEKVCLEWKDVAELVWRTYTEFDGQYYTQSMKESFKCLSRCAPSIKKIIFPPLFTDPRSVEFLNIVAGKCLRVEHVVLDKATFRRPLLKNFMKILGHIKHLELTSRIYAYEDYKVIFKNVPELQSLRIQNCFQKISPILAVVISYFPSTITEIHLGVLKYVESAVFLQLYERCPNIEVLTLKGKVDSETIGSDICKFTKLRHLELHSCGISIDATKKILTISNLEKLALSGAGNMTDDLVDEIAKRLPNLTYLDIHGGLDMELTDEGLKKLAKLHNLEYLDISYSNWFSHEGVNAVIAANVNLKKLLLISTSVSENVIPAVLTHCRDLRLLDLSDCTDVLFESFLSEFDISTVSKKRKQLKIILGGIEFLLEDDKENRCENFASLNVVLDFETNNAKDMMEDYDIMFDALEFDDEDDDDDDDFDYFYESDYYDYSDSPEEFGFEDDAWFPYGDIWAKDGFLF